MAKNLLKARYALTAYDVRPEPVHEMAATGAQVGVSPAGVAAASDVVITMLPNSPEVREVVLGRNGVIEGARPGTIVVDMSSIAPLASQEISARLAEKGVTMLDAPVSGGEPKAIDGRARAVLRKPRQGGSEAQLIEKQLIDLQRQAANQDLTTHSPPLIPL